MISHSAAKGALSPAHKRSDLGDRADQFIVDNSDEHWKALEYLRQWCEISESIDIATGHFEIGALLALDGAWQKVPTVIRSCTQIRLQELAVARAHASS